MDNVPSSMLFLIAGVLLMVVLSSAMFFMMHAGLKQENTAANQKDTMVSQMKESKFDKYVGSQITGSQLISIAKDMYYEDVEMVIQTIDASGNNSTITLKGKKGEPTVNLSDELVTIKNNVNMNALYTGSITYSADANEISVLSFNFLS